jgi:hypothetical protein
MAKPKYQIDPGTQMMRVVGFDIWNSANEIAASR